MVDTLSVKTTQTLDRILRLFDTVHNDIVLRDANRWRLSQGRLTQVGLQSGAGISQCKTTVI